MKASKFFLGLFFGENIGPGDDLKPKTALLQFSSRLGHLEAVLRWIIRTVNDINDIWKQDIKDKLYFHLLFLNQVI